MQGLLVASNGFNEAIVHILIALRVKDKPPSTSLPLFEATSSSYKESPCS
jgi:hypothetical protein